LTTAAFAITLVLLPAAGLGQGKAGDAVKTTLCDVATHPARFTGKLMQLQAYVTSGPDVPAGLYDRRCPPNNLLHVDLNNKALIESKGYKDLQMYLKWTTPVEATMTGVFVNKKVRPDVNTYDSTFELLSITDVAVKTRKEVFQTADPSGRKK
jgi:hypothetical protein